MDLKLTVLLFTYNHKDYFKKSIESVLAQETNFDFVIHIFDDASTDGTSELVREYAAKYPTKIVANINDENIGCVQNIYNALSSVKTKYYATCETDDYWIDNFKLQKQVDILENNPDCAFCGHNTYQFDLKENKIVGTLFDESIKSQKIVLSKKFDLKDFIKVHPSSRVCRTECLELHTLKNKEAVVWDSPSFWYFLSKGKLYYLNEVMSVYNYTYEGLYSGSSYNKRKALALNNIMLINEELDYEYNFIFLELFKQMIHISRFSYILAKYFYNKRRLWKFYKRKSRNLYPVRYFMSNGFNNLGDVLNKYILEKLMRGNCIQSSVEECNLIAIGSILDQFFFVNKNNEYDKSIKLNVWGSGFISDFESLKEIDASVLPQFRRELKIYALRGKLSQKRCEKMLNVKLNKIALGDPGLLASKLIDEIPEKQYDVGIIPHYIDKDSEFISNIKLKKYSYHIIDITGDTIETLKEIAKCRCILSSAMHGLIVSDSLGIPNKWITFSDNVFGNGYKFRDYYSVFGIDNPEPIDVRINFVTDETIRTVMANYPIKYSQVESIQERLLKSFPWKK